MRAWLDVSWVVRWLKGLNSGSGADTKFLWETVDSNQVLNITEDF